LSRRSMGQEASWNPLVDSFPQVLDCDRSSPLRLDLKRKSPNSLHTQFLKKTAVPINPARIICRIMAPELGSMYANRTELTTTMLPELGTLRRLACRPRPHDRLSTNRERDQGSISRGSWRDNKAEFGATMGRRIERHRDMLAA
jgi:hypothetical protein